MSKFIRLDTTITDTTAPFMNLTPGVTGYTDRYMASRVAGAVGSSVTAWAAADVGSTLTPTPGGTGPITIQEESGLRFLRAPGGGGTGRLLGANKGTLPFTMAAVVRAQNLNTTGVIGVSGVAGTKASGGIWTATGGATVPSANSSTGWVFLLVEMDAAKNLTIRADALEATAVSTLTLPTSSSGIYFGPSSAVPADIVELVYWPTALNSTQRSAVHAYMKAQYPVLP